MAELNDSGSSGGKKGSGKVRSKKANAKVDLTAMVDLAFLLITFFMLTTTLSKPQSMDLGLPDKPKIDDPTPPTPPEAADDRTVTVLLGAQNELKWYYGLPSKPFEGPSDATYGKAGIRAELLKKEKTIAQKYNNDPKKGMIVIIKPSKKSTYKNMVDILDEMAICNVKTYAIVDITPDELAKLEKK